MRMKQLMSRAKKYAKARAKQARRMRMKIAAAGLGIVLGVTGAYAASRLTSPSSSPAVAKPSDTVASQRATENKKAAAELAMPAADYAGAPSPVAAKTPPAVLIGCLEQKGDEFRLKDAAGADAPKSRSWKSGFLKKSTPAIDVVDASNHLKLHDHVGQRVSISGTLVNREMQAKSLKGVGTCN
jgi:hypothetical protein